MVSNGPDPRIALVEEAAAFWNKTLGELGSGFRLGGVTVVDRQVPERDLQDFGSWFVGPASMTLVRAAAEGKAFVGDPAAADVNVRAARRVLTWLVDIAPRIVPVAQAATWQREHGPEDIVAARPLPALLAEACYAGTVELYVHPPRLAAVVGERPCACPVVRWQARRQQRVTNLRHESLRIDDPLALKLLALVDGTRTRGALAAALAADLPPAEQVSADQRVATYLAHFALHGLLVG